MRAGDHVRKAVAIILGIMLAFSSLPLFRAAPAGAAPPRVKVWLTSLTDNMFLAPQPDIAFADEVASNLATIAVDEDRRYQSMVGYGASFTDSSAWLVDTKLAPNVRNALMRELFSREQGIGLGIVRQPMGASDFSVTGNWSYDDMPAGQADPNLSQFSIEHDIDYILPLLKRALTINPQLRITASPWSPPGWMKTSDSMIGGGLKPEAYGPLAEYFVRFIKAYQDQGVRVHYITPNNEPLYEPGGYPGMLMRPEQELVFIRDYLGPALSRARLRTAILAYDHNWDVPGYPEMIYSDPAAAGYTAGTAWHCYAGDVAAQTAAHNAYPNEDAHLTECSGGEWQGTPQEAFNGVIGLVINGPRHWARSVVLWNMALDETNGPTNGGCLTCRGVVTIRQSDGTYTKNLDYYALGHASKFVLPGAVRIGSSTLGAGSIETVAFRNPDGSNVLIAHNSGTDARTFEVAWGDSSFQYSLKAGAAATFTWTGSQSEPTKVYESLARAVDIPFQNPSGSRVLLTYSADQEQYQHLLLSGERAFAYTLPVGASLSAGSAEVPLSRDGWTAMASASATADPPMNALDGNLDTRWSAGHGQTNGDWFQVDMGATRTFDGILLDSAGSTGDFARSYQVYVSNDGQHWGSAIASGPGSWQLLRVVFPTVSARYIRVVNTGSSGNWWSVAEFNVFAFSGAAPVDSGAVLQQSFTTPNGAQALAVYNPYGTSARFSVQPWPDQVFAYTLPAGAAAIFTWIGTGGGLPPAPTTTSITPQSGLPGAPVVLAGANFGAWQGASAVMFGQRIAPVTAWSDTAITVSVPEGLPPGPVAVTAVVYGRASNPQQFTVLGIPRTNWSASASSSADGEPPGNALDGQIATRWSSGRGQAPGMWFQVDMGASQTINQVVMDSGYSSGDYARGYEIYVSDDGVSWGSPVAAGAGDGRLVTASFAAQTARYIRVVETQETGYWWSIAEFYALGP